MTTAPAKLMISTPPMRGFLNCLMVTSNRVTSIMTRKDRAGNHVKRKVQLIDHRF